MKKVLRFLENHIDDIGIIVAVCLGFAAGFFVQSLETSYYKELLAEPEPDICRACEGAPHAPVLVNLSTGQTGELKIYDSVRGQPFEINREENGDACTFTFGPGATITRDQKNQNAKAWLPDDLDVLEPSHFCRDCRALLAAVSIEGFALLDLHDPDDVKVFEIAEGASYEIRDYTVQIYKDDETKDLVVDVTGHVFD